MANILGVLALSRAQLQQQLSIALLKRNFDMESQAAQVVAETADAGVLASGGRPLNATGFGQIVNILV